MKQYVWYASYGSNISRERFLCYIKGGRPKGSNLTEVGCKDPSLPLKEGFFSIPNQLYFAKEAGRWKSQGVAFIDSKKDSESYTISKKYLITYDQFLDVLKQENNGAKVDIDLNQVKETGSLTFLKKAWYGKIIYLGEDNGYLIYTFTAPWDIEEVTLKQPSHEYLQTIITGLKDHFSEDSIYEYLKSKPGIKGIYTDGELKSVVY
ncbi:hypothetical protein [Ferdinandcohnia sp. Marseille-Q9671]